MEGGGSAPFKVSPGSAFRPPAPPPPARQYRGEAWRHGDGGGGEGSGGSASRPNQTTPRTSRPGYAAGSRTPPLGALPPPPAGEIGGRAWGSPSRSEEISTVAVPDADAEQGGNKDVYIQPLGVRHPRPQEPGGMAARALAMAEGDSRDAGGMENREGLGRFHGSDAGAGNVLQSKGGGGGHEAGGGGGDSGSSGSSIVGVLPAVPSFGAALPQGGLEWRGSQHLPPPSSPPRHFSSATASHAGGHGTPRTTPRKPGGTPRRAEGGGTPRVPFGLWTPRSGISAATSSGERAGLSLTQPSAFLHWQTHHGNADKVKWREVFEGLATGFPSA